MCRDSIQLDIFLDFFAMIIVVPKRVENLCKSQVREIADDFFRTFSKFPAFHNRTNGCAGGFNNRLPAQYVWNAFHIWVICNRAVRHFCRREGLAQPLKFCFECVKTSDKSLKIE